MSGAPIVIKFSRPIEDIENFVDSMFSSREPLRFWGVPRIEDGVAELEAVDLHVGELLRVDIGMNWLRVFLPQGGCGNSIVRLVSNLQHRFDAILSFADSELQAALRGTSRAPSSDNGG